MIEVKKIEPCVAEHFDPNGNSLGFLNEYENIFLRTQVCKEKIAGYYLIFKGQRVDLLINGKLSDWPNGLYDDNFALTSELFKAQREHFK